MSEPIIEWWSDADPDGAEVTSVDYGTVDAGTESGVEKFFVYNDRGGTGAGATPTAEDVKYTTFDNENGDETEDLVTQKWLEVLHVSNDGTGVSDAYEAVGGSTEADKKTLPNIAEDTYQEIDTKVVVPSDPDPGQINFVQRVEFTFT